LLLPLKEQGAILIRFWWRLEVFVSPHDSRNGVALSTYAKSEEMWQKCSFLLVRWRNGFLKFWTGMHILYMPCKELMHFFRFALETTKAQKNLNKPFFVSSPHPPTLKKKNHVLARRET